MSRPPKKETGERVVYEAAKLLDTPFVLRGRVPGVGIDCMGLVVIAHREAGLDVPDPRNYRGVAAQNHADMATYRRAFRRVRREDARPGDMALIAGGDQAHQAIVAEAGESGALVLYHADDRAAVSRVVLAPLSEDLAVRAVYRHRSLP